MTPQSYAQERVIKVAEASHLSGLSRSQIYALSREGKFPRIFKLSEKSSGLLLSEVSDWIKTKAEGGLVA